MSKNNLPDTQSAKLDKFENKTNKPQGQTPATGTMGRSLGSEFAYAVGNLKEQAKSIKGSKNAFQGVPSQLIDPKQYAHSIINKKEPK